MKTGVLLINLGTPAGPDVRSVRRYLAEFLMDRYVIDLPWLLRAILVYGVILPTRPKRSAAAYQEIWQPEGSPLRFHGAALLAALQAAPALAEYEVALGMRYGQPSIASAVAALMAAGCERVQLLPLFPQYSLAATASALTAGRAALAAAGFQGEVVELKSFFSFPPFITAVAASMQPVLGQVEHVLMSYHGLPVRQIDKTSGCQSICSRQAACPAVSAVNTDCYRAQCYATSRAVAAECGLTESQYTVSFQSRLGRLPWIQPYTESTLDDLRAAGIRDLAVVCPSFVADCLETIEEIGMQARAQWQQAGGRAFHLVPCVNADDRWVQALTQLITDTA